MDAAARGWNVALAEQRRPQAIVGERYFAGSFLENELAQSLEGYWTVTNWKALKRQSCDAVPLWMVDVVTC